MPLWASNEVSILLLYYHPASVSVHREQLPYDGVRVVELPCGLAVGSHVTVVARPRPARPEYDPKIAERKDGEAPPGILTPCAEGGLDQSCWCIF